MDTNDWLERAKQEPIVNIGQIDATTARVLDRAVKRGEIFKWRGHWNNFHPDFGIGPLKTCWGPMPWDRMVEVAVERYGWVNVDHIAALACAPLLPQAA